MLRLSNIHATLLWALPLAMACAISGCSMPKASDFKPSKLFSLTDDDEPEKGTPVRMVSTWTDTVLTKPGQTPQRGFGGRLMFYENNEEKPILVDGELVIYAFNETNRAVTDNKPTRRYVFPPEQIASHMSKSELGASYSFWLPWDESGGPQTEVSLICRFQPKGGAVVTGEQTRHRLPGSLAPAQTAAAGRPLAPKLPEGVPMRPAQITLESQQENRAREYYAQQASYESAVVGAVNPAAPIMPNGQAFAAQQHQQMTTTSIALPDGFRLPMNAASAQPAAVPAPGRPQPAPQQQVVPTPVYQQQANPALPMQSPMTTVPGGAAALQQAAQSQRIGVYQTMPAMTPTVASPTIYSPTNGGFGFGFAAQSQQPQQPFAQPALRPTNLRSVAWNTVQTNAAQGIPVSVPQQQQHVPGATTQQQQTVVQPASKPLPPSTGLTTTVSYPSPATALR